MRRRIVWYMIVFALWLLSLFGFRQLAPNWVEAANFFETADKWLLGHAAYPSLFALLSALVFSTVLLPEVWRAVQFSFFSSSPKPNIGAAKAFRTILYRSKWAKQNSKNWQSLRPLQDEEGASETEIIEGRLVKALVREIHDLLGYGTLTAWGRQNLAHGPDSENIIPLPMWDEIEANFDAKSRTSDRTRVHANRLNGVGVAYLDLRFNREQLFRCYPLGWTSRRVGTRSFTAPGPVPRPGRDPA